MAVEIELKARLDGPEPVKGRLDSLGAYLRSYEKNDTYWIAAGASGVRVRRERGVSAAGEGDERVLVTYKTKEIRDGIEINDEREFSVSGAAVFEELLDRLGLKPDIRKEKKGWAWTVSEAAELRSGRGSDAVCSGQAAPVLAELSLVTGLGWFIELEILAADSSGQTVAESRRRLFALLEKLGIPPERIEERPYTQMLRNLSPGR